MCLMGVVGGGHGWSSRTHGEDFLKYFWSICKFPFTGVTTADLCENNFIFSFYFLLHLQDRGYNQADRNARLEGDSSPQFH